MEGDREGVRLIRVVSGHVDGGNFVGEAMLDTLVPCEKKLAPYALESSVAVLDDIESHSEHVYRLVIRNGPLTQHARAVRQTTYHLDDKSATEQVVYPDRPREGGIWHLHDTAEAAAGNAGVRGYGGREMRVLIQAPPEVDRFRWTLPSSQRSMRLN